MKVWLIKWRLCLFSNVYCVSSAKLFLWRTVSPRFPSCWLRISRASRVTKAAVPSTVFGSFFFFRFPFFSSLSSISLLTNTKLYSCKQRGKQYVHVTLKIYILTKILTWSQQRDHVKFNVTQPLFSSLQVTCTCNLYVKLCTYNVILDS